MTCGQFINFPDRFEVVDTEGALLTRLTRYVTYNNKPINNSYYDKCSDRSMKIATLLGNYDRPTDKQTTNVHWSNKEVKLPIIKIIMIANAIKKNNL